MPVAILLKARSFSQHRFFFPALLVAVWFVSYFINLVWFEDILGWDEIEYISVAQGIALDQDYSSTHYTVMGLLRQGYPTHLSVFPLYASYLAVFFKSCGLNLHCLYFSNWLAGLVTALLIYSTYLLIRPANRRAAFVVALLYIIFPGIWRNFNTALMEPVGALLAVLSLNVLVRISLKRITWKSALLAGGILALMWLYKTIFIGILGAALVYMFLAARERKAGEEKSLNPFAAVVLTGVFFALIFSVASRLFFYPLSPFFAYDPQAVQSQAYADLAGGFFNHPVENLKGNAYHIARDLMFPQLVYPAMPTPYIVGFATFVRYFYFVFAVLMVLAVALWKKFSAREQNVIVFALLSTFAFHVFINVLTRAVPENLHRYTIYYAPLFLIASGLIMSTAYRTYVARVVSARVQIALTTLVFMVFYVPLFATMFVHQIALEKKYHALGTLNTEVLTPFVRKKAEPTFIYFNKGSYIPITLYPVKQVSEDASDEQFFAVNSILPSPIDRLFLRPKDLIYKNHQVEIEAKKPILNGEYEYIGTIDRPSDELFLVVYGRK